MTLGELKKEHAEQKAMLQELMKHNHSMAVQVLASKLEQSQNFVSTLLNRVEDLHRQYAEQKRRMDEAAKRIGELEKANK